MLFSRRPFACIFLVMVITHHLMHSGEIFLNAQDSAGPWQRTDVAREQFVIQGLGERHNPLRRSIDPDYFQDQIFVRFQLQYGKDSIDDPEDGDGEFFVFWFDTMEGGDSSPHANNIPNLGLHTDGRANRFMVRYKSSEQKFAQSLQGGRDYVIVGLLSKTKLGSDQSFDQLQMWIDPKPDQLLLPDAVVTSENTIKQVNWVGFSTGLKTEIDDEITVTDLRLARSWSEIMDLSLSDSEGANLASRPTPTVSFQKDVLPIFVKHCFDCHRGENNESGVRLDQFDDVLNQISPYDSQQSELLRLIADQEMPPGDVKLNNDELQVIASWIDEGMQWDHDQFPVAIPKSDHWAFQPIKKPVIPVRPDRVEPENPIDWFMLKSQQELGTVSNAPAPVNELERRLYLDLHGLPVPELPVPELPASGPAIPANEQLIKDLMDDTAYGERWGRHWLDLVRWAESNGHQHNRDRNHAWRYRDWVIQAFSTGMDYHEFVMQQIAGDTLPDSNDQALIATGYLAATRYSGNELDKDIQRNDILNDITANVGSTFLGLTIECAQCHNHKFDPISIRDYYQLQGFFASGQPQNLLLKNDPEITAAALERETLIEVVRRRIIRSRRRQNYPEPINVAPMTITSKMSQGEKLKLKELDAQLEQANQTWAFYSPAYTSRVLTVMPHLMRWPLSSQPEVVSSYQPKILIRGDVKTPGPSVESDWPAFLRADSDSESTRKVNKNRHHLAQWLLSETNPLTARVWVNRLWQWHFGRGLVHTPNDFGVQGAHPTHPELLDYLAAELIESDWDTSRIQQLIVQSDTYRVSSAFNAENESRDPENHTYWRWQPRRLEAEVIRDSMLALSGKLDRRIGGSSDTVGSRRRSLYLKQKRADFPFQQDLFDGPSGVSSCALRQITTNALQPLWLLNNEFVHEMAEAFAERAKTVDQVFRMALNREPNAEERERLHLLQQEHGLASVCMVIFNSSEFLYIP